MLKKKKRGRPPGPKTRCGGRWTESEFKDFVMRNLRSSTRKWAPIGDTKKKANVSRGQYLCASCKKVVPVSIKEGRKRINNVFVDHIKPVVDPKVGWTTWDSAIDGLFCEADNLQLLCGKCHDEKTLEERRVAKERRDNEKQI